MFNKETYIQRRNRLKKEIGKGILLFLGNNESGMNYADNTYHFRQDSTFLYFFGSDYAGLSALIDIDEDREIIFGDELTIDDIVWMGTQPTIREKSASVGITATAPTAQLSDYLNKAVQQGRRIHYLPPYRGEHHVTLLRLLGIAPEAQVAGASTELIRAVVGQRNYKSAEEIREIEEAVNISADMHIRAMQLVRPGMKECEIAAAVTEVALQAHQAAVAALRPGIPFKEVHLIAARTIAEGMKSIGLMKGDPDEAARSGAYALFFPCGLGHMMGLDVHDMENLGEVWVGYNGQPKSTQFGFKSLRLARPLEPGFVFTIEPGIYFIPELIDYWRSEKRFCEFIQYDKLEPWKGFSGIRNEEDYLITPDGARRLGKYKPMTIGEVEGMK